jgi:hypothetical protein
MPWFKIDDGFWSHPKTLQLSDGAQALWMRAGSWSMHHLTDGLIPAFALPLLRAKPRFVTELVAVSLWIPDEGAYRFHDWSRYQPTRDQVEADRDAAAERKRRSREKSRRDTPVTDGEGSGDAAGSPSHPVPSRPVPPDLTDTTYVPESGHVGDRAVEQTDLSEELITEAQQVGVRDLAAVLALFEPIVGSLKPQHGIELAQVILRRAKGEVLDSTAYIARACEKRAEIRRIAVEILDLPGVAA